MALQSGRGVPFEFIEYKLCEKFSCLPSDLENQSWEKIENFLQFIDIENQYQEREERKLKNKRQVK